MDYERLKKLVQGGDADSAVRLATEAIRRQDYASLLKAARLLASKHRIHGAMYDDPSRLRLLPPEPLALSVLANIGFTETLLTAGEVNDILHEYYDYGITLEVGGLY